METRGCGTALVTPFRADGELDTHALVSLVHWQIESGIDFLVVCGSTGEAATLEEDEWLQTVRLVVETAATRVPVWAGCTHNSTRTLVRQAKKLIQIPGIDAILSANPYYNRPSQEGQYQHFAALAEAVQPIPVVLYNVPGRTAVNLEPETVLRLARAYPNIQAIKEASGKLAQIAAIHAGAPAGFKVFSGDDSLALPAIEAGAQGLVSVASNEIPYEMTAMLRAALQANWPPARDIERLYAPLFAANFWEPNPAPVKAILSLMGRSNAHLRLPLVQPTAPTQRRLEALAAELGLLRPTPQI